VCEEHAIKAITGIRRDTSNHVRRVYIPSGGYIGVGGG